MQRKKRKEKAGKKTITLPLKFAPGKLSVSPS